MGDYGSASVVALKLGLYVYLSRWMICPSSDLPNYITVHLITNAALDDYLEMFKLIGDVFSYIPINIIVAAETVRSTTRFTEYNVVHETSNRWRLTCRWRSVMNGVTETLVRTRNRCLIDTGKTLVEVRQDQPEKVLPDLCRCNWQWRHLVDSDSLATSTSRTYWRNTQMRHVTCWTRPIKSQRSYVSQEGLWGRHKTTTSHCKQCHVFGSELN